MLKEYRSKKYRNIVEGRRDRFYPNKTQRLKVIVEIVLSTMRFIDGLERILAFSLLTYFSFLFDGIFESHLQVN